MPTDLKEKILKTAFSQLEKNGYDEVSMRSIAKDIGITHPAIYTYFKSKEDIFITLKVKLFRELKSQLFESLNPHDTFEVIMSSISNKFISYFEDNKTYYKVLFLLYGNGESYSIQLQILEYLDEMLLLPQENINLPQIFWYSLIGHYYAYYMGEITNEKLVSLIDEMIKRLSSSQ